MQKHTTVSNVAHCSRLRRVNMKIVQCIYRTTQRLGLLSETENAVKLLSASALPSHTVDLLALGSREHVVQLLRQAEPEAESVPVADVQLIAPVTRPDKVLCIGMNYVDHCAEQNQPVPTEPVVFNKFPSCIIGPYDDIHLPSVSDQVDWEAEMAMVVGQRCSRASPQQAANCIFGYTVAHDVTARDWQKRRNGGQWLLGKAMDTFCPLGPCLVPAGCAAFDPHNADISCTVNGLQRQKSSTSQLVFGCEQILSHISQCVTLLPGDVILTGTPPGVGVFRDPPVFLRNGDIVECSVKGIGIIRNKVV